MTEAQKLGHFAEDTAAKYILSLGWKVIARNVRNSYGELDIVALDTKSSPEELVIIEVRARTVGKVQSPLDSIGPKKLSTLIKSSREFIDSIEWPGFWRIDIAGITIKDKNDLHNWELEHVKNITEGMNISS